jgi:hypothetical protein
MRRLVLQGRAVALVAAARLLLKRHDTTSVLRRLAKRPARQRALDVEAALVAVQRAGRLAKATCLPQSIALAALLTKAGKAPELVLGCRRYEDRHWGAHAWLIADGVVLEPVPAGQHIELAQMSAENNWLPASTD